MGSTAEVIVVGGGIMGISNGYHVAAGSTANTYGVIHQHYSIKTLAHMAFWSLNV